LGGDLQQPPGLLALQDSVHDLLQVRRCQHATVRLGLQRPQKPQDASHKLVVQRRGQALVDVDRSICQRRNGHATPLEHVR
jgi:hypothetical protein